MKAVFLGSADFGIPALSMLLQRHEVAGVVTIPPKPAGRGLKVQQSPVALFALQNGLKPLLTPANLQEPEFLQALAACAADLFVVTAYRLLPRSVFAIPRLGTVNIHGSLLPAYRGPAPIQRAIEAGEKETGVTVFSIDEGVDTGGILLQKRLAIGAGETTPELYHRLSLLGAQALEEALAGLEQGTLRPRPQDNAGSSRASRLSKEEARINWRLPAESIWNKIRAFKPFPGTYTLLDGRRLGIEKAEPEGTEPFAETGVVSRVTPSSFEVRCSRGVLRVLEVKPEGRRAMSVHDFLLGRGLREGTVLP
jgi:methionyl-tRNA formyltransferase